MHSGNGTLLTDKSDGVIVSSQQPSPRSLSQTSDASKSTLSTSHGHVSASNHFPEYQQESERVIKEDNFHEKFVADKSDDFIGCVKSFLSALSIRCALAVFDLFHLPIRLTGEPLRWMGMELSYR